MMDLRWKYARHGHDETIYLCISNINHLLIHM